MKSKNLTDNLQDLPKWVQSEIKVLQMRLREANAELERIKDNPESNTIVGYSYNILRGEKTQYLKDGQLISFVLKNGAIEARIEDDFLTIRASGFATGDLFIRPQVSNTIQIHLLGK